MGISLAGKTIGIIGLGHLGSHMASSLRALNMTGTSVEREPDDGTSSCGGSTLVSKDELLSSSDAISIHLVLSPRSRGLIGAQRSP